MGKICQCEGCYQTRLGRSQACLMNKGKQFTPQKEWTLSWGVWRNNNEISKEQGEDSQHFSLDECKEEVKRLVKHYNSLNRTLWFANAKHVSDQSEMNIHR